MSDLTCCSEQLDHYSRAKNELCRQSDEVEVEVEGSSPPRVASRATFRHRHPQEVRSRAASV